MAFVFKNGNNFFKVQKHSHSPLQHAFELELLYFIHIFKCRGGGVGGRESLLYQDSYQLQSRNVNKAQNAEPQINRITNLWLLTPSIHIILWVDGLSGFKVKNKPLRWNWHVFKMPSSVPHTGLSKEGRWPSLLSRLHLGSQPSLHWVLL